MGKAQHWVAAIALTITGGVAGCKSSQSPGSGAAVTTAAPPDAVAQARRIALAPSRGEATIDLEIAERQRVATHLPRKEDVWITLGQSWVKKARAAADPGFYVNANACAQVALDLAPESRLARDLQALTLLNDHAFDAARALEEAVLARAPDDAQALGSLSDALLELGRFEDAAAAAQRMMDLKPNLPSYSRASHFRWLQGDDAAAKLFAREAIDSGSAQGDREPRAWAIVQAAQIFWHEGDWDGAEAGYDRALEQLRDYAPALVGKGRVAMARGDGAMAAASLARAYAESPLLETAWLLGDARTLAGDDAGARDAYALVESRGRASDPRTLSLFWSTKGAHAADALALAQAEARTRGDIYTSDALAWALYRSDRLGEARAASERAIRLGTKDARLLFHAGAIRIASGDGAEGEKLVALALQSNPKFDLTGAKEAEAILAKRRAR